MKIKILIIIFMLLLFSDVYFANTNYQKEQNIVEHCDLVKDPDSYKDKMIKVQAIYFVGANDSKFYSEDCKMESIWVEFDSSYKYCTNEKIVNNLTKMNKKAVPYFYKSHHSVVKIDYQKSSVIMIGRFELNNVYSPTEKNHIEATSSKDFLDFTDIPKKYYKYVFKVYCIEKLKL